MKEYVIDVNILFSGLISKKKLYEELFLRHKFYTPDFALLELNKYKKIILSKLPENRQDFESFTLLIFSNLIVVPSLILKDTALNEAESLCRDIDIKDSLYVALAIFLNIPLLTRDKPLYHHLQTQGFTSAVLFDDFVAKFLTSP